ncbi:hypothetical protein VNI00_019440 [Paramarasmius palmivorus]|uniref:Uncharacterized protein n=1 Tax=Paramarasmius palmivorus TaxID=297713 RepID=A0AAW0ALK2_9AGAR
MSAEEHQLLHEVQNKEHPLVMAEDSEFASVDDYEKFILPPPDLDGRQYPWHLRTFKENRVLKALCTPPRPIAFPPPIMEPELIDLPTRGHGEPMKDWMAKRREVEKENDDLVLSYEKECEERAIQLLAWKQFRIAYEEVEDKQVNKWLVDIKADEETAKKLQEKEREKTAAASSEDKGEGCSSGAAPASASGKRRAFILDYIDLPALVASSEDSKKRKAEESPERSWPSTRGEKKTMPEVKGLWMLVSEGLGEYPIQCTNCIIKKADCWVQVEVSGGRSISKCLVCRNRKVKCSLESGENKKAKKSAATLPDEESADNIREILLEIKTLRTDMEDAQAKKLATLEKKMGRLEKKLNVILAWVGAKESSSEEEPEDKGKGKGKAKAEESEEEDSEEEESEEESEEEESEEEKTPQPRMTRSQKGKGAQ